MTHKEYERWRQRQTFRTEAQAVLARLVGFDFRLLEQLGERAPDRTVKDVHELRFKLGDLLTAN